MTNTATGQPSNAATEPAWMEQAQREFAQWLDEMDELGAARMLQMLTTHPRWLGELRAAVVYGLTRDPQYDYKTLGVELGVSRDAINKAVTAHNRQATHPAQTVRDDEHPQP